MFLHIVAIELKYRFTHLQVYVYTAVFVLIGFLNVQSWAGAFGTSFFGQRLLNGPYHLAEGMSTGAMIGVLVVMGFFGQAVYRDFHHNTAPLIFTTPLSKGAYLGGRYVGALIAMAVVMAGLPTGLFIGTLMPWLDAARFGPHVAAHYLWPYLIFVLPTLAFTGALFLALPALTRRILPNYVGGVALLVGYLASMEFMGDLDRRTLAALMDPFGYQTLQEVTRYWTVAEQNTLAIPLEGLLLANRLLWLAVGLAVFGLAYVRFRFAHEAPALRRRSTTQRAEPAGTGAARPTELPAIRFRPRPWLQFLSLTRQAALSIVRNVYFAVIVVCLLLFAATGFIYLDQTYGTAIYPVTSRITDALSLDFRLLFVILIAFFAGELVWQERDRKLSQLVDALPVAGWVPHAAKLTALVLVQGLLLVALMGYGLIFQTAKGYFDYELGLYLTRLFVIEWPQLALLCALAMAIHVIVNHKYAGHFIFVLYFLFTGFAEDVGLESNIYQFGMHPGIRHSDMNGFGHFAFPATVYLLYWGALALLLAVATRVLWVRGEETGWRWRRRLAGRRASRVVLRTAAVGALLFIALGGFIFYNTNVLNEFEPAKEQQRRGAAYEREYKHLQRLPQPRLVRIDVAVDLFPERRRVEGRGTFTLVNRSNEAIPSLYLNVPPHSELRAVDFDRAFAAGFDDERLRFREYRMADPLAPGDTVRMTLAVELQPVGFENTTGQTHVVRNGTFINSTALFPDMGYAVGRELANEHERRAQGLPPQERWPAPDDRAARMRNYITPHADWIDADIVVSTSGEQTAVAPGSLLREWSEDGRRYFHFGSDGAPMLAFYSVLSAEYEVARERWRDVDVEVYYHPTHTFNIDRFVDATKRSLDYLTENFGPYQFRQARIVEFPRYDSFAQAFPGTMPYSEGIGFIARVRDRADDIDYPLYVTAHEVAHQWWAHQVIGGAVQGTELLSEGLASYSALRVLEQVHGPHQMRRFLEHELDGYLSGRASAPRPEVPLLFSQGQGYLHYRKAALAFYALSDYIGEDRLNRALRRFRDQVAYQHPPYTSSMELYAHLREATPDSLQYLLEDLFEHITLWDLRTERASYREREDGRYEVMLDVRARKVRADSLGVETEVPMDDWIDIGVFAERRENGRRTQHPLYLEKHRIPAGETRITVVVDERPLRAGIDPYLKLIARDKRDNAASVTRDAAGRAPPR
jgi:ABC-2 type transport system permease protein